jgi:TrmH family RNA methyltransferase
VFVEDGDANEEVRAAAASAGVPIFPVTSNVSAALSDTTTPQGVVAVARERGGSLGDLGAPTLVLVLAGVSDPGNAGTLVRSAVAAGADAVVFAEGSVDPFAPKTVRSAAGALFGTTIVRAIALEDALEALRAAGLQIVGAEAGGPAPESVDLAGPVTLVVGNEAWGIPAEAAHLTDATVGIPMPGPAESLNVGIAGSILLFEVVRRRRLG